MKTALKFAIVLGHRAKFENRARVGQVRVVGTVDPARTSFPKSIGLSGGENIVFSAEVLLVLKTRKAKLAALEKLVLPRHPNETPEYVVLPLSAGNKNHLNWLAENT